MTSELHGATPPDTEPATVTVARRKRQDQLDFDIEFYDCVLGRNPHYLDVLRVQGELLSRRGLHEKALSVDRRLADLLPDDAFVWYNLACSLSQMGMSPEALAALRKAFEQGYDDLAHLAIDTDLDSLRDMRAFDDMLREFGVEQGDGERERWM